ncbi:peptidoglycan endopeptidase [Flavisphingopyxis soli]|uniref:peptidoglycan endopeptidase n=1 Tax=Flavisphingopyxis soli TaxID=2601267 RepID=UPI001F33505E|nr:peptidoglycan endopeptidase [Sphingorhabdus soli]
MDERGTRIFAEAQGLVGCRFRLHGRDPALGLDCVGVAWVAARRAGAVVEVPDRYALIGGRSEAWNAALARCGLVRVAKVAIGDIVLIDCGRRQFHLAVAGAASAVHAHRGLGRVVETPGLPDGAVAGVWRVAERLFADADDRSRFVILRRRRTRVGIGPSLRREA